MMARSRMEQSLPYQYIKDVMDYLSVAIAWIVCYIEMTYMDIEDKLYYVHTMRPLPEANLRRINQVLDDNESESLFGFRKNELQLLLLHWRIPQQMRESNRVFAGEEAMLIFLYYIRHSNTYIQMSDQVFGGDPRLYTHFVRAIANHLYSHFYHKLSGDSMRMWLPFINDFREAIWEKMQDGIVNERSRDGTEVDWEVWVPFETFRIFGWLDDTDLITDSPRPGRTVQNANELTQLRDTQQAFYK